MTNKSGCCSSYTTSKTLGELRMRETLGELRMRGTIMAKLHPVIGVTDIFRGDRFRVDDSPLRGDFRGDEFLRRRS